MLRLSGVDVSYGGPAVLCNLSLDLTRSHHVLMGGSGSGKSTILKVILAAFLNAKEPDLPSCTGNIEWVRRTSISYLPQEPSLASWLTVRKNIELGRKLREGPGSCGIGALGETLIERLQLTKWLDESPSKISLGTARRVALVRCLVSEPDFLLLDEPFSGLDFDLREQALDVLASQFRGSRRQIVMVTHEPYEAAVIADYVHVLPKEPDSEVHTLAKDPNEPAARFEARVRAQVLSVLEAGAHA